MNTIIQTIPASSENKPTHLVLPLKQNMPAELQKLTKDICAGTEKRWNEKFNDYNRCDSSVCWSEMGSIFSLGNISFLPLNAGSKLNFAFIF